MKKYWLVVIIPILGLQLSCSEEQNVLKTNQYSIDKFVRSRPFWPAIKKEVIRHSKQNQ
jgi:hypothetical protein